MSNTSKIVTGLVVIVVIVGLAWLFMGRSSNNTNTAPDYSSNTAPSTSASNLSTNSSAVNQSSPTAADTSNASLNSDLSAIDAQMTGLSSDSTKMDQSANP